MKIEKWIVAHFSPTGGTKKVADAIAAGFGTPITEVDLTAEVMDVTLGAEDGLMAVLPVYAGRVSQRSLERLSAIEGKGQKAVAVVVYGNREYDDALLETKNALEAQGFRVIAAAAFIAEHSILRSVAAGRPDEEDITLCKEFAREVMAKPEDAPSIQVPGNFPYLEAHTSPFHPAATEACLQCGLCAQSCPTGSIPVDAPDKTIADTCINCLRCVQLCPVACRAMPAPFMDFITKLLREKAAGYKKPAVFL